MKRIVTVAMTKAIEVTKVVKIQPWKVQMKVKRTKQRILVTKNSCTFGEDCYWNVH